MTRYHLDCASGIAGDMFLGACLDLGMPLDVLADTVARLHLPGVSVESRRASRGGFAGTRFRVLADGRPVEGPDPEERQGDHDHGHSHDHEYGHSHDHGHSPPHEHPHAHPHVHEHGPNRGLTEIRALIESSALSPGIKERAIRLFTRLGEAESRAHGMPIETVHFHEVGAVDSIVDLVGAAAAIEYLAPERLTCGPVNVGSGRVRTAHGELSVPAPATALLLAGIPIHGGPGGELTTPTGAVLLAELVDEFVDLPPMVLERTGSGLGRKQLATQPNVLRLLAGRAATGTGADTTHPEVAVVECEVDDLPGEGFGYLMERLLEAGALDVYFTPVVMKKSRPGTLVTLLCRPPELERLAGLMLLESGSLGCRYYRAARFEARREIVAVETAFGTVRVKRSELAGRPLAASPEFEDCRRLALDGGVTWREVYGATLAALGQPVR